MRAICDANCKECELFKNNKCYGCNNGCPFGKKCWIAKYIEVGDQKSFEIFKKKLIDDFNALNIEGMPNINDLYSLHGKFVNLEYLLPNGERVKLLNDNEAYLGNQVESMFNNGPFKKYYGLLANMNFILVCEYEENGSNPEVIVYKRR